MILLLSISGFPVGLIWAQLQLPKQRITNSFSSIVIHHRLFSPEEYEIFWGGITVYLEVLVMQGNALLNWQPIVYAIVIYVWGEMVFKKNNDEHRVFSF